VTETNSKDPLKWMVYAMLCTQILHLVLV